MSPLKDFLRPFTKLCIYVAILATISQVFSLLDPAIFRHVIDDYALKYKEYSAYEFFYGVGYLMLCMIGVAFVSRTAKNFQEYYLSTITQKVGANLYRHGVEHLLALPYKIFEGEKSGDTLNILQKARDDVQKFITSFINIFFVSLVGFLFVSIYAFTVHYTVALMYFLTIPIIGGVTALLSKKLKIIQKSIVSESNALAGSTTESLRNIELVKSLGLSRQEIIRLNSTTDKILALELKKLRTIRSISFVQGTFINFMRSVITLLMMYLIFSEIITFGQFFTLFAYSFAIFGPLQELGTMITNYRDMQVSLKRFNEFLSLSKERVSGGNMELSSIQTISFKNVFFKYKDRQENALSDVSFSLEKGKTVAFVGPSGSGKTSIVKLLVGLYEHDSGDIEINSLGISQVNLDSLRKRIGFVTQDTQLFAGTIRENLLFVKSDATDSDCMDALEKSASTAILDKSSDGLDTVIGEGGIKLSGGEKQRLSIARALLRKPNILILDEATSSLDSITEEHISTTIRNISNKGDLITLMVAHRLSTIMHADCIYVMEKGKIIEFGTHKDLVDQKGLYYALWREQIGG